MTVPVKWRLGGTENWHEAMVPVPEFDGSAIADFAVHFLRNGEIKVFATRYAMSHPDYPLKGDEAGLYQPGGSPAEKWEAARNGTIEEKTDAAIGLLRRDGATNGLTDEQLRPFIRQQIDKAYGYGVEDWESVQRYVFLALFSNGEFVNAPMVKEWLQQPRRTQTFEEWSTGIPDEVMDQYSPYWTTLEDDKE